MVQFDQKDPILRNIAQRITQRLSKPMDITLIIDPQMEEFCGKIENGVLSAGSYGQLLDVTGRFLRNPEIDHQTFHSHKKMCGMYFATHFQNYLDAAPLEEIFDYIDDLAFWGMNTLKVWFDMHHFRDMAEGKQKSDRLVAILNYAHTIGIKTWITTLSNESFVDSPKHLRADWTSGHDGYIRDLNDHYHLELCPSKPGGMEQIIAYRRQMLEVFAPAQPDFISIGPYDQGGCTCKECAPWGSNGYLRTVEALIPVIREYLPHAKIILSTWQFGTFTGNDVEFEGLQEAMAGARFPEVAYSISEPQYAHYPFCHDMHRPLINFPEISMFGAAPWGGYGANPLPKLFQGLWEKNGDKLEGGIPYSEGLYEDINKVIVLRQYRDNQPAEQTVREYLAYEFGLTGELLEKTFRAVLDMEETLERIYDLPYIKDSEGRYTLPRPNRRNQPHQSVIQHPEKVFAIEQAILEVDRQLAEKAKNSKKWQLLKLRALIDAELTRNKFFRNETVLGYYRQLVELCHLHNAGMHTKPDIAE